MNNPMKNAGMALISTLIMLSLMALLVLSQMQMNLVYYQFSQQRIKRHQQFKELEKGLKMVIARFLSKPYLSQGTLSANDRLYGYLIEDLGTFSCVQSRLKHRIYSTHHWLMTISLKEEQNSQFIQIRFAQLVKLKPCSLETVTYVQPGILSWRFSHALTTGQY